MEKTSIRRLIEALLIVERHAALIGGADHDIIYLIPDEDVTEEERTELEALGCHMEDSGGGWAKFV